MNAMPMNMNAARMMPAKQQAAAAPQMMMMPREVDVNVNRCSGANWFVWFLVIVLALLLVCIFCVISLKGCEKYKANDYAMDRPLASLSAPEARASLRRAISQRANSMAAPRASLADLIRYNQ